MGNQVSDEIFTTLDIESFLHNNLMHIDSLAADFIRSFGDPSIEEILSNRATPTTSFKIETPTTSKTSIIPATIFSDQKPYLFEIPKTSQLQLGYVRPQTTNILETFITSQSPFTIKIPLKPNKPLAPEKPVALQATVSPKTAIRPPTPFKQFRPIDFRRQNLNQAPFRSVEFIKSPSTVQRHDNTKTDYKTIDNKSISKELGVNVRHLMNGSSNTTETRDRCERKNKIETQMSFNSQTCAGDGVIYLGTFNRKRKVLSVESSNFLKKPKIETYGNSKLDTNANFFGDAERMPSRKNTAFLSPNNHLMKAQKPLEKWAPSGIQGISNHKPQKSSLSNVIFPPQKTYATDLRSPKLLPQKGNPSLRAQVNHFSHQGFVNIKPSATSATPFLVNDFSSSCSQLATSGTLTAISGNASNVHNDLKNMISRKRKMRDKYDLKLEFTSKVKPMTTEDNAKPPNTAAFNPNNNLQNALRPLEGSAYVQGISSDRQQKSSLSGIFIPHEQSHTTFLRSSKLPPEGNTPLISQAHIFSSQSVPHSIVNTQPQVTSVRSNLASESSIYCSPLSTLGARLPSQDISRNILVKALNTQDLKKDLKNKILTKRELRGQGELKIEFSSKPKPVMTVEEVEKAELRKKLNNESAARHRQNEAKRRKTLEEEKSKLEQKNSELGNMVMKLEQKINNIIKLLPQVGCSHDEINAARARSRS